MQEPFVVKAPRRGRLPILISVPHAGIAFPDDMKADLKLKFIEKPEDTDWLIHELYDFALDLGATLIYAPYSRYVIDLNRDPQGQRLYGDKRAETNLIPVKSFAGEPLYKDERSTMPEADCSERLQAFYWPYYRKIEALLADLQRSFSHVLLYDAHSIARFVPTIAPSPFRDLILGSNDGASAAPELIATAVKILEESPFSSSHNHPFKGGHITRYFGRSKPGVHALQLERSHDIYLRSDGIALDASKLKKLQPVLGQLLTSLAAQLQRL